MSESQENQQEKTQSKAKKIESTPLKILLQATTRLARTADGVIFFQNLMNKCGYRRPSVVANPQTGEICSQSTVYNEARRNLWLEIRRQIEADVLNVIEKNEDKNSEKDIS